jgi:perosamine synthetase
MYKIPVYQPSLAGNEKVYVNECLDSTWISSKGKYIELFEKELANYVNIMLQVSVMAL